jgi:hypothetical protein
MKNSTCVAIVGMGFAGCLATAPAIAQEGQWAAGVTGGSLGIGPQLSYRPNDHIGLRVNAAWLGVSRDEEIDDIDYDGDLDLNSFGALLDWYPTGGGFRVSIGGRINNTETGIVGRPTTSVTVGGTTYTPQQIGTLSGTVTTDDFAPQLTIGYGGAVAKGFTLGAEIGVLWQGQPRIDNLRATGLLASTPQFQADIQREEQEIENELDDYELWPILQVEFLYRF